MSYTIDDSQIVTISQDPVQMPDLKIPLDKYLNQLLNQQTSLQSQLDAVNKKIDDLTNAGNTANIDVSSMISTLKITTLKTVKKLS